MHNLAEVLSRLERVGFRLNLNKCDFFKKEVFYLGHKVSKKGLEKDDKKVEAILKMPRPRNPNEIKIFAGMVNYYSKYINNLSPHLKPLYELVQKRIASNGPSSVKMHSSM